MKKYKIKMTARGWPWQSAGDQWSNKADKTVGQKWGWNPFVVKGMGRFGGGWAFKFGVMVSSSFRDFVFDLGIGSIRLIIERRV